MKINKDFFKSFYSNIFIYTSFYFYKLYYNEIKFFFNEI